MRSSEGVLGRVKRWIWIRGLAGLGWPDPEAALDYPALLEDWFERRRLFLEREKHDTK
jgi:hypothetical protein